MCSVCLAGFKDPSVNRSNALGDESACSGTNTLQSARCRFKSVVLLTGLLAFTLTGVGNYRIEHVLFQPQWSL